jgi:hypothetical protein
MGAPSAHQLSPQLPTRQEQPAWNPRQHVSHLWARLPEHRVVSGDGEVAHHVQDVAATDRIASDHCDDGLWAAPDLNLQLEAVRSG